MSDEAVFHPLLIDYRKESDLKKRDFRVGRPSLLRNKIFLLKFMPRQNA